MAMFTCLNRKGYSVDILIVIRRNMSIQTATHWERHNTNGIISAPASYLQIQKPNNSSSSIITADNEERDPGCLCLHFGAGTNTALYITLHMEHTQNACQ